jgi:uncharacterized protein (DUF2062 family)/SAM-dependent methyltransferase
LSKRFSKGLRDVLFKLRTEGISPEKQAGAVAVGVLIGCSPFYGFHLLLCLLLARLLRLNPALTYLAAHISVPGLWPLLVLAELETGRRLRGESYVQVHFAELRHLGLRQIGGDLLLGSAVIGGLLALALGFLTFRAAKRRQLRPEIEGLIEGSAAAYLDSGMLHWEFVRGKLRHDPLYFNLLRQGLLPPAGRLLDLGCGRGILFALLLAAREKADQGRYPPGWASPPSLSFHGIEGRAKTAAVARRALAGEAEIETADLRTAPFPAAEAVLLLDVLHYLAAEDQEALLAKAAAAVEPGGVLLLREADAGAGWRFTAIRIQERFSALLRGDWRQRFHYRGAAEWGEIVRVRGLTVDTRPMGMGTPYANVLLAARRDS